MKLALVAYKNIFRNKVRSALTVAAVGFAAMAMVVLYGFFEGMKDDMRYNLQSFFTGEVRIRDSEFDANEDKMPLFLYVRNGSSLTNEITETYPKVSVAPRIYIPAKIYRNNMDYQAYGLGVEFEKEIVFQKINENIEGALPQAGKREVLIGAGLANKMKVGIGDKITVLSPNAVRSSNAYTLTISGIKKLSMGMLNNTYFFVPLSDAQKYLFMFDGVSEILIKTNGTIHSEKLADAINQEFLEGTSATAVSWTNIRSLYSMMQIAEVFYLIFGIFFFMLAGAVIFVTTMMVIYERVRELGTLSALGMSGKEIVNLILVESTFLAVFGTIVGTVVGMAIVVAMGAIGLDFSAMMEKSNMEVSSIIYPSLSPFWTTVVFFYSILVSSLISLIPARRAAKIKPIDALKYI